MDSQGPGPSQANDRRRGARFPLEVPVSLKWKGADGLPAEAEARAVEGNSYGGFLEGLNVAPPLHAQAALSNLLSRQTIMVKVIRLRDTEEGVVRGIGVEFLSPDDTFWGALGVKEWVGADFQPASPPSGGWRSRLLAFFRRA